MSAVGNSASQGFWNARKDPFFLGKFHQDKERERERKKKQVIT